jgi:rRNA-processing protein FCF1
MMMTIFKPTLMFSIQYSFGKIVVHQLVIDEIERWQRPGSKKYNKFGPGLLSDALGYCRACEIKFTEPAELERKKHHSIISAIENKIAEDEKSAPTSTADKDLLMLAKKHKAKLATQEQTLRTLSKRVIGAEMLLSFEDLIIDILEQKLMTKVEVLAGLETLARFNEKLRQEGKPKLMNALKTQP